jgi:hypothetical protein
MDYKMRYETFEELGSFPTTKHHVKWLGLMLGGEDVLITLGGLQLAIPCSRLNLETLAERIEDEGPDPTGVAWELGFTSWDHLKAAVKKLPDEGWCVTHLGGDDDDDKWPVNDDRAATE